MIVRNKDIQYQAEPHTKEMAGVDSGNLDRSQPAWAPRARNYLPKQWHFIVHHKVQVVLWISVRATGINEQGLAVAWVGKHHDLIDPITVLPSRKHSRKLVMFLPVAMSAGQQEVIPVVSLALKDLLWAKAEPVNDSETLFGIN